MRIALTAAAGLLAYGAWEFWRRNDAPVEVVSDAQEGFFAGAENGLTSAVTTAQEWVGGVVAKFSKYTYDAVPFKYRAAISAAEQANGLPPQMLARLLWQESRYREDIISGRVKSSAGALGIAQFMPKTAPEWAVNLYDGNPFDDIAGAGKYLAWLYKQTGAWDKALAAYNWGLGNVRRKGLAAAPIETKKYYSEILADIGAGVVA